MICLKPVDADGLSCLLQFYYVLQHKGNKVIQENQNKYVCTKEHPINELNFENEMMVSPSFATNSNT